MNPKDPTYLYVPRHHEARAIALGALYDADRRQFYVPPRKDILPFREWFKPRQSRRQQQPKQAETGPCPRCEKLRWKRFLSGYTKVEKCPWCIAREQANPPGA
ncbi:DUF5710 domain-containing protein [Caballeronia sp. LjRoot31]|uniref:DUF5710 domain-containing protein n=1 Tax=Caballeronia sp. LjRoot31 TaxID=3342324 RepID=UPI003F50C180